MEFFFLVSPLLVSSLLVSPLGVSPFGVLPFWRLAAQSLALGVSLHGLSSVSPQCHKQRSVYQSAYLGIPLPKRPSEASRTNMRTLVHPCPNNPWRHDMRQFAHKIERFLVVFNVFFFSLLRLASCPWRLALDLSLVSRQCHNPRPGYQSAYPGIPLPKRPSEASRTNMRTLVHPCQNNPGRHDMTVGAKNRKISTGFEPRPPHCRQNGAPNSDRFLTF